MITDPDGRNPEKKPCILNNLVYFKIMHCLKTLNGNRNILYVSVAIITLVFGIIESLKNIIMPQVVVLSVT